MSSSTLLKPAAMPSSSTYFFHVIFHPAPTSCHAFFLNLLLPCHLPPCSNQLSCLLPQPTSSMSSSTLLQPAVMPSSSTYFFHVIFHPAPTSCHAFFLNLLLPCHLPPCSNQLSCLLPQPTSSTLLQPSVMPSSSIYFFHVIFHPAPTSCHAFFLNLLLPCHPPPCSNQPSCLLPQPTSSMSCSTLLQPAIMPSTSIYFFHDIFHPDPTSRHAFFLNLLLPCHLPPCSNQLPCLLPQPTSSMSSSTLLQPAVMPSSSIYFFHVIFHPAPTSCHAFFLNLLLPCHLPPCSNQLSCLLPQPTSSMSSSTLLQPAIMPSSSTYFFHVMFHPAPTSHHAFFLNLLLPYHPPPCSNQPSCLIPQPTSSMSSSTLLQPAIILSSSIYFFNVIFSLPIFH